MPVRATALGAELDPATVDVTARMTLAYAAGIGDVGPRTFDDAAPAALVAPPAFCVRLEWVVLLPGRAGLLGLSEAERLRAVHVEQDSTFRRPLRPGDRVITRGRVVAIRATRAGALVQTKLTTTLAGDPEPCVTSFHSSIYRGVGVEGGDGRVESAPEWPAAPPSLPARVEVPIARQAAHVYTECAGIWNPIHSERRVALAAGLPDVILHGSATWALAGREIVKAHAGGDPTRLRRLRARFQSPVVPGGTITVAHAGIGGDVHFEVANERGQTALAGGYAQVD